MLDPYTIEIILASFWMPISINIIWTKKVGLKNRLLSIILMSLEYCAIITKECSEKQSIYLFPAMAIVVFFCLGRDILSLILVPGTYVLCVFSNYVIGLLLDLFHLDVGTALHMRLLLLLSVTAVIISISLFVRKATINYSKRINIRESKKLQWTIAVIISIVTLIYLYIGWQIRNYDIDDRTANVYVFIYYASVFVFALLFFAVSRAELKSKIAQREEENKRNLLEYTAQIENMYEELRAFKHDYSNMLLTLSGFIDSDDMEGLRGYYQKSILPTNEKINKGNYHLHKLSKIQDPAIKGMLSAKFINAINQGVDLFVDIMDAVPDISMKVLDLTRVLGIYIDNAVEAALETDDKEVKFNVIRDSNAVVIVVANSYINKGISIKDVEKHSVSTKGEGRGIGLSNVRQILSEYPNVNKITEMKDKYFVQTLVIENA